MSQLTGLMRTVLAAAAAIGVGGDFGVVFVQNEGDNSATIIQRGPFGSDAKFEVKQGDGYIVIEGRDGSGGRVTIIQGDGRGER